MRLAFQQDACKGKHFLSFKRITHEVLRDIRIQTGKS